MANAEILLDPFAYMIKQNRPRRNPRRFDHGWRTDMLAIPKSHKEELEKFSLSPQEIEQYERLQRLARDRDSADSSKRLHQRILEMIAEHTKDLSLMPVRVYKTQRKVFKDVCGKKFEAKMKRFAEEARQTIYHEYAVARSKMKKSKPRKSGQKQPKKRKSSSGKGRKKRTKAELKAAAFEHVERMATPKQAPEPEKISRGKHGEINAAILDRLNTPKFYTPKFVDNSMQTWKDEHFVSPYALTYVPTTRIFELAAHKIRIMEPPVQVGAVDPDALHAKATPRILELAIPKARSAVQEVDFNEDAFKVSPNALHYKATERIIELAKPKERD